MRHRSPEQVSLHKIDPCRLQGLELLAALNSLGCGCDIEPVRQREYGSNHRRTIPAACKPLPDRPVDLDLVEWKAGQVAGRGVPSAAIVEHERDAKILQLP